MQLRILLCLAIVLGSCDEGGGSSSSQSSTKKAAPAAEEVQARADEVYATFRSIHDNLPDTGAKATACPDEKIREWTSGERETQVTFLAYQSLRYALAEPWDGNNSIVRFLTNSYLRYRPKPEFALDDQRNVKQLMRLWNFVHYIGVVIPASERKSKALSASVGSAGAVEAQLVIYRKGEAQPICNVPFRAEGSGTVQYSAAVGASSTEKQGKAAYALKKDLCYDIKKSIEAAIGSVSKVLTASRIDCNSV